MKRLKKQPSETMMNKIDAFREKQEDRQLTDAKSEAVYKAPMCSQGLWIQSLR